MIDTPARPGGFAGAAMRLEWPRPRVALATFSRDGELNALSLELVEELERAVAEASAGRAAALIFTGQGRAFCAGADLKLFLSDDAPIGRDPEAWRDRYIVRLAELFDALEEQPFVTIAAINGYALGGGAELALSCDFRVMARHAVLGLPETRLGAMAGAGGVQKLIRHVGRSRALDWILTGRHVNTDELAASGLLHDVIEGTALIDAALALADRLAALSPAAVAQSKRAIYLAEDADLRTARRYGVEALCALMGTREWLEGVSAFDEKRPPRFVDARDSSGAAEETT